MKFSDLNSRVKKNPVPVPSVTEEQPVKKAPLEKAPPARVFNGSAKISVTPPNPLDMPLADFPERTFPVPGAEEAPKAERSAAGPEASPVPAPALSRKTRQRAEEAAVRASARPLRDMDTQAREIYSGNLSLSRDLLSQIDQPYVEKYERIMRAAELNSRALPENPLILNYTSYATAGNYLYAHSANVALISQAMGLALGLEKSLLGFLGFCAMAHDIGMTDYEELVKKEERLTDAEYAEVTLHTESGSAKIDRILDIDHRVKERAKKILFQVHERIDGSGYPDRLSSEEIDALAQVIGIADVYEAMSHPRSWRPAIHPHKAVKHLIDKEGKGFNSKIVKAMIEVLSIYPPGSMVALSTGEIASVVIANKGSLTRPVVSVLLDPDFEPVRQRFLDLAEHPLTGIDRIVEEAELAERNPKFASKQEMARWWVEW